MTTLHPGGCLCGKVRFEAAVEPLRIVHCHCIFCRRQTGGPLTTFAGFKRSTGFTWSRGAPAVYYGRSGGLSVTRRPPVVLPRPR